MYINFDKDYRRRDVIVVEAMPEHVIRCRDWNAPFDLGSPVVYLGGRLVTERAAKLKALDDTAEILDNLVTTYPDRPHDIVVNPFVVVTFYNDNAPGKSIDINPDNKKRGLYPEPIRLHEELAEAWPELPEPLFMNEGHPLGP
jgi:hypothetical protein